MQLLPPLNFSTPLSLLPEAKVLSVPRQDLRIGSAQSCPIGLSLGEEG